MWAVYITSSFSRALSTKASEHFNVFSVANMSEHEDFYFTSSHLTNIEIEDFQSAFHRAKALIRILNGILRLKNLPKVAFEPDRIFYMKNSDQWSNYSIYNDSQLEYKELQSPFQANSSLLQKYKRTSEEVNRNDRYVVDIFDLAYNEELAKEVLILFSLTKIDPLYLLVNTLKIIETIEFDLGLQIEKRENGKKKKSGEIKKERKIIWAKVSAVLGDESANFFKAYNFFKAPGDGSFQHFINTRDGSGIFARHGANNNNYQDEKGNQLPIISFDDIEHNIRVLIYEWVNYKLVTLGKDRYPLIQRESGSSEGFGFDL